MQIFEREPALLEIARRNMPRLPVHQLDVLLVDELGKNFSGTGLDTNIIGRRKIHGEPEPESPRIRAIAVFRLSPESHGNAVGVGLADVITKRLFNAINHDVMATNVLTSNFTERGKTPLAVPTDADAYMAARRMCFGVRPGDERVIHIHNTLHLDEIQVSRALEPELSGRSDITWEGGYENAFDERGNAVAWKPR